MDNHIEFTVRFLVHPKKRNVLDDLWISIIKSAQKKRLTFTKNRKLIKIDVIYLLILI